MCRRNFVVTLVASVAFTVTAACSAVDVTPSQGGGSTPQMLAESIADTTTGVTVVAGSAGTTINNPAAGNPNSDPRAYGSFINGVRAPDATYAGGIEIDTGVCLCTGVVSDSLRTAAAGLGFGVEGPNNGDGSGIFTSTVSGQLENHTGEITTLLFSSQFVDQDFEDLAFPNLNPGGGDPTVLEFDVQINSPGILQISFVFGSDEYPFYVRPDFDFNDSVAIIINGENIATTTMPGTGPKPFNLFAISACPLFVKNDTAAQPAVLRPSYNPTNLHAIPSAPRYDVEFGGFTKRLTRQTNCPLAPGVYRVKIVVQDVADQKVDAAVFIESHSLKLFSFLPADFDLDGDVDGADFMIWYAHYDPNGPGGAKFTEGDADGNGLVDGDDLDILSGSYGATGGNANFCADFNRDGWVGGPDFLIWQRNYPLAECASRAEGDADGDGDVDDDDLAIYQSEFGGTPSGLCGCAQQAQHATGGGGQSAADLSPEQNAAALGTPAFNPDLNADGAIDQTDVKLFGELIDGE